MITIGSDFKAFLKSSFKILFSSSSWEEYLLRRWVLYL